jgi:3-deoxy-D-manno-octulosonate 8-phosphate phosphatase (KDO 8-P phosphatase)
MFVFDIDGVLTDGMLIVTGSGPLLRQMNIKDGYALPLAVKQGYHVVIISGGKNDAVKQRLAGLGVTEVYISVAEKRPLLHELLEAKHLSKEQILYMGDDVPDYEAMLSVGLPTCPADACDDIRGISAYISPFAGGKGCVRDVVEKVLKLNHHWPLAG